MESWVGMDGRCYPAHRAANSQSVQPFHRGRQRRGARGLQPPFSSALHSTGVLKLLVLLVFVSDKFRDREILLNERLDFFGFDKLIESAAPPSPGSVEEQKDTLMSGSRVGLGQNFISRRSGHRREGSEGGETIKHRASKRIHGPGHRAIDARCQEQWPPRIVSPIRD